MMNDETCIVGSDNLFADLGLSNPEERLARAQLLCYIVAQIKQRGLSEAQAAALLDVLPPDIRLLLQAKMSNFSLDRLLQMVARLGLDVSISFQPAAGEYGRVIVSPLQPV
jgi:predicted XRE-type DNA-binding protein